MVRGKEFVNFNCKGRVQAAIFNSAEKCLNCLRRRRQADKIEVQTPQQGRWLGIRGRREAGHFELCQDEMIQVTPGPSGVLCDRRLVRNGFLKGPEPATRLHIDGRPGAGNIACPRIWRAHFDPAPDVSNDRIRQPVFFGRHFQIGVGVRNGCQQHTGTCVAGDDGRTAVAACSDFFTRIKLQAAF
jgi:hypothetical protein